MISDRNRWLWTDFHWLLDERLLGLHSENLRDREGRIVELREGQEITAYDGDGPPELPDDVFATGVVEPPPAGLQDGRVKWALRIDMDGFRHESDLRADA